jgi:hypothetical protein
MAAQADKLAESRMAEGIDKIVKAGQRTRMVKQ